MTIPKSFLVTHKSGESYGAMSEVVTHCPMDEESMLSYLFTLRQMVFGFDSNSNTQVLTMNQDVDEMGITLYHRLLIVCKDKKALVYLEDIIKACNEEFRPVVIEPSYDNVININFINKKD